MISTLTGKWEDAGSLRTIITIKFLHISAVGHRSTIVTIPTYRFVTTKSEYTNSKWNTSPILPAWCM